MIQILGRRRHSFHFWQSVVAEIVENFPTQASGGVLYGHCRNQNATCSCCESHGVDRWELTTPTLSNDMIIVIPSEGVPVHYRDSSRKKKSINQMGIRFVGSRFGWVQPSPVTQ